MQIVENYTKLRAKEADKAMFFRVNSNQIDAKKKLNEPKWLVSTIEIYPDSNGGDRRM